MAIEVRIPTPFRRLTGNRPRVRGKGATIDRLLVDLDAQFPGLSSMLLDEQGRIPPHIKVYVNGQEISSRDGMDTELKDGDEVAIIPATAGG
jgi:MoaD family protein